MRDFNQAFLTTFERQTTLNPVRLRPVPQRADLSGLSTWKRFWLRMATRRVLRELSDDQLQDIGLTRQQALQEAYRPFWRLLR